ncbi:hypothetical protein [Actinomycetia phage DSL-LC01]|nr:hypothetical protein [Actinomycetia phage DSL-LC01]
MRIHEAQKIAEDLADQLTDDILKCTTREEHVRVTARANSAVQLLMHLNAILIDEAPEED